MWTALYILIMRILDVIDVTFGHQSLGSSGLWWNHAVFIYHDNFLICYSLWLPVCMGACFSSQVVWNIWSHGSTMWMCSSTFYWVTLCVMTWACFSLLILNVLMLKVHHTDYVTLQLLHMQCHVLSSLAACCIWLRAPDPDIAQVMGDLLLHECIYHCTSLCYIWHLSFMYVLWSAIWSWFSICAFALWYALSSYTTLYPVFDLFFEWTWCSLHGSVRMYSYLLQSA